MRVKIKKLSENAKVPTYGSSGAAAFDLYAAQSARVWSWDRQMVSTDLAFEVPDNHVMLLFSRSGHGVKGIRLGNCVGVIDSDYRGPVKVCIANDDSGVFEVEQGARIAQALILPVEQVQFELVDKLSDTQRGEGGFGHTGDK